MVENMSLKISVMVKALKGLEFGVTVDQVTT